MPVEILQLGRQFRPATSVVYPPFKNGRYMEEFFYEYVLAHREEINSDRVYIPVFWTNLQIHPNFSSMKSNYNILLERAYKLMPPNTKYFTIVQDDDGVRLSLPPNTLVFGACQGDIPLPLIYEDTTNKLTNTPRVDSKKHLASFVGTHNTHALRTRMFQALESKPKIIFTIRGLWTNNIPENLAETFIRTTLDSKFCLAPRGNGRSSFRYFEAMLLDSIPVYFWDDVEWLPYKDVLDYSKFAVSIHDRDINRTSDILESISDEKYQSMLEEMRRVRHHFSLEGMSEYILNKIKV